MPLIRLDDTRFVSNAGETEAQRLSLLLRIERLNAQVEDRPLNIPEDVRAAAPTQAINEQSLYESRRQQFKDEIGGLQEQLIQRQQSDQVENNWLPSVMAVGEMNQDLHAFQRLLQTRRFILAVDGNHAGKIATGHALGDFQRLG